MCIGIGASRPFARRTSRTLASSIHSDCAEGCCGFTTGKCAGPVVALTRDGGCGFGNGVPTAKAAKALC
ncbi:hypothetical protein DFH09DRAFT_954625 [Mycena vulgaris]|nr:hypothetical protein DFH09DRAFT_954625 [Mycena vulgaris]